MLNNNINKDENKKEEKGNNKEKSKENELIKSNDYISATEEKEKSPDINSNDIFSNDIASNDNISNDNTSNDYKIEEVHSYNPEETKKNKSKKTKVIKIKKKKKLNISITDKKNEQNNKQKYIINPEDNNPINVALKKSLNYNNKEYNKDISDSIKDNNDDNNIYLDEESKRSETSYKNNKNNSSTVTKKLNFGNLDKAENEEEENKEKNIPETNNIHSINNKNIQANDQDTSKDNDNSEDLVNKMKKFNNIVNLHIKYNGKIDSNTKSPIIKKRKKIKKKKFLISVDNKGNIRPTIEEKQIKIIKRTTLIRSKSKDKPKERKISQDIYDSNISKEKIIKNNEINFKVFKNEGENSSNYNEENSSISMNAKRQKEINNIKKINKIKNDINNALNKDKRKIKLAQGKNNTALLLENTEEVYIEEKNIKKVKKTGLRKLEKEINKERTLNKSVDDYKNRHKGRRIFSEYSYDEMRYLLDRSNSYKKVKKYKKFSEREKINCIKFENGVSCLLEINSEIFALGNLIGDIIIINSHTFKEIQVIREHDGTIISLCLLNDESILSCSADRKILKIRVSDDGTKYNIEFIFHGYEIIFLNP